ncbi:MULTISPECIES: hypothetical protein [Streptomyces]|uniref:Uncharacterized protein n=1 Tax=Streptomyces caniscabiei TaxID=2746961 RepID=A0ABU4MYI9_9ACTN|nr:MULTISPECIES: hypothetical protein [Streptomyces]MBE4790288.1 hypothetical protein [Streptomyces caniscabiei]MBE4799483.1 hypothetical protein [Streptomyces caniscabiei]MDX3015145.1 hypothetical protein [Streptomyces caniscabiei]MDX3042588.1 hypothetical protein [Streptomyces caniscabiei]
MTSTFELNERAAVNAVKAQAVRAWLLFTEERGTKARPDGWTTSRSPDGSPVLTAQIVGPDADRCLRLFTSEHPLILGCPGDQRPGFDYSVPGRVICVWRSEGVWVQIWHPDTDTTDPAPRPVPPRSGVRRLLQRPSARLPYTRNRRKETPAA